MYDPYFVDLHEVFFFRLQQPRNFRNDVLELFKFAKFKNQTHEIKSVAHCNYKIKL